jgi:hypothetical protein
MVHTLANSREDHENIFTNFIEFNNVYSPINNVFEDFQKILVSKNKMIEDLQSNLTFLKNKVEDLNGATKQIKVESQHREMTEENQNQHKKVTDVSNQHDLMTDREITEKKQYQDKKVTDVSNQHEKITGQEFKNQLKIDKNFHNQHKTGKLNKKFSSNSNTSIKIQDFFFKNTQENIFNNIEHEYIKKIYLINEGPYRVKDIIGENLLKIQQGRKEKEDS